MYMSSYADKRFLLSHGICSGYDPEAAAEQEGARKFTKDRAWPNERVSAEAGRRVATIGASPLQSSRLAPMSVPLEAHSLCPVAAGGREAPTTHNSKNNHK